MLCKRLNLYCMNPLSLSYRLRTIHGTKRVGNRDVVGHGWSGIASYKDDAHFPFPSIRFQEDTAQIMALREKEKGDWRSLTIAEKKSLYRASFCQTFAEFQHPTGQWKIILGGTLILTSLAFWMVIFLDKFVNTSPPPSLSESHLRAQLRRMLDLHVNPVDGLASHWDYGNDCWKSETKRTVPPPSGEESPPPVPCDCGCAAVTPVCQCDE